MFIHIRLTDGANIKRFAQIAVFIVLLQRLFC